jgi:hypothetical protein
MAVYLTRGLLALGSLLLCLLVAEAVLRVLDYPPYIRTGPVWIQSDVTGAKYAPHLDRRWKTREFDVTYRTNSLGMRDEEVGPKRGFRILLLGDSYSAGYGVERHEQFADRLEERLGAEILNAATGGWDLVHQYHYFQEVGTTLSPDLVLYAMYVGNDLHHNDDKTVGLRGIEPRTDLPEQISPARTSRLWQMVRRARVLVKHWQRAGRQRREWVPYPEYLEMCERELSDRARSEYAASQKYLRLLRDEVAKAGAPFVVAQFSYRTVIEPDAAERLRASIPGFDVRYDLEQPPRLVAQMLDRLGVDSLNLNPALKLAHRSGEDPLFYFYDSHFTARGHRVVAEALEPKLRAMIGNR